MPDYFRWLPAGLDDLEERGFGLEIAVEEERVIGAALDPRRIFANSQTIGWQCFVQLSEGAMNPCEWRQDQTLKR